MAEIERMRSGIPAISTPRRRRVETDSGALVAEALVVAHAATRGDRGVGGKICITAVSWVPVCNVEDVALSTFSSSSWESSGDIATGLRRLGWDLAVGPSRCAPILHLRNHALYEAPLPSSKLVTPLADGRVSGSIRVDRGDGGAPETWDVSEWPAMIGHNWGRSRARLYAWVHCNSWDDAEDLAFEAVSARVRVGPVLSPMGTAVFVRWKGRQWDLNARELFGNNRGAISMRRWEVVAAGQGIEVRAEVAAETDDFVGLHYPNPSEDTTYCLDTKLARTRLELHLPGRPPVVATSRAGALEIGTREREHGVRMYL